MKFYAALIAALGLCACHPNDTHIKTVKDRMDAGEVIEMTGKMHGGCKNKEWSELRTVKEEQKRIVIGKQEAFIGPKVYQCYKTGESLPLEINGKTDPENGVVKIQRVFWARGDLLYKSKLNKLNVGGKHFDSSEDFNKYMANVKSRSSYDGYVHILELAYHKGTAAQEKVWIEEDRLLNLGDGFKETLNDGEYVESCRNPWTDIRVLDPEFHQPVLDGRIQSAYQLGRNNCLKTGTVVDIKTGHDATAPVIGKAKIKKVKLFRVWALDRKYFILNNFDFATIEAAVKRRNSSLNNEFMTVTDFEVVP